jgi:hypothetical protein
MRSAVLALLGADRAVSRLSEHQLPVTHCPWQRQTPWPPLVALQAAPPQQPPPIVQPVWSMATQVWQQLVLWLHPLLLMLPSGMMVRQKIALAAFSRLSLAPFRLVSTTQPWLRLVWRKLAPVASTRVKFAWKKLLPLTSLPWNPVAPVKSQPWSFWPLPIRQGAPG